MYSCLEEQQKFKHNVSQIESCGIVANEGENASDSKGGTCVQAASSLTHEELKVERNGSEVKNSKSVFRFLGKIFCK